MELKQADLPFNPYTKDVVCRRDGSRRSGTYKLHFNISQTLVQHSPDGFEWGYQGSGPADFALNILHLFLPPHEHTHTCYHHLGPQSVELVCTEGPLRLWHGFCSPQAYLLHQQFKRDVVAKIPDEGGTIRGWEILRWIGQHKFEQAGLFSWHLRDEDIPPLPEPPPDVGGNGHAGQDHADDSLDGAGQA